jgi:predicted AlkP superfamily phosphohydrolase/phosphomutase
MKTIIIGLDAFDPTIFEKLHSEGKTPHLSHFVKSGGYSRFSVSNPPQSEVSWTSIATGLNPGGHGIFDFVHRNPSSYAQIVSLLPTKKNIIGRQFVPPHRAHTVFDAAVEDGYPGVSLWWPATFPARLASPVWSIPGLGTPDIFGRLGVGIIYSMDGIAEHDVKTRTAPLSMVHKGRYIGELEGPTQMTITGVKKAGLNFELRKIDEKSARLTIDKQSIDLSNGNWSPHIELTFKVGFGVSVKAVTRVVMNRITPYPTLYFLPLQIHPLRAPWAYGTPKQLVKDVWNKSGPYLTLGWPQDTTGLEEGFISDNQFLSICDQICDHRERTLLRMLDSYQEGVFACIFDSLDRIQHMFLRDRVDIVESWYVKLDSLLGRIKTKISSRSGGEEIRLIIVSDHGFGEFNYKVNLNKWLINRGYLHSENSSERGKLNSVIWEKSKAYAIGLNSMYLNISGREGKGSVPVEEKEEVIQSIKHDLSRWKGPDGRQVVRNTALGTGVFKGPFTNYGPDIVVGYNTGYRASAMTGLGDWDRDEIIPNRDHWGADHCFDPETVPGVIFSSHGLNAFNNPSYADFPSIAIGKELQPGRKVDMPTYSDEDQEKIEERLKELGYL